MSDSASATTKILMVDDKQENLVALEAGLRPLNRLLVALVSYAHMLGDGADGALTHEAKEFGELTLRAPSTMGTLIEVLISYALAGMAIGALRVTTSAHAVDRADSNLLGEIEEAGA